MRTLIVGGTKTFIENSLRGNLTDLGLDIAWHIDDTSRSTSIPEGCECVLVLKEMTGGGVVKTFKSEAKRLGIRHAEIPHKFSKARQTLLISGIVSQEDLRKADIKRVASPTETVTSEMKFNAAVDFILDRLREGVTRTSRDMIRGHMKTVFGPRQSISDKGVREARKIAADKFESEQNAALDKLDSSVRESIHMLLDDYPETANPGVYTFLASLFEAANIDTFLSGKGITRTQLDNLIAEVRRELFTKWSTPFAKRTEEEHQEIVEKRFDYIVRLCLWGLREKGALPTWEKINSNCKKVFGSISQVDHVKKARKEAEEKFAATQIPTTQKTEAEDPTPVSGEVGPTPWFRRVKSNYRPETVEAQLRNGISLYEDMSPGEVAVISAWMEKVITRTSGKPQRPDTKIRQKLQGQPPLTLITVLYLCWGFLREDLLAAYQYRDLYKTLTSGKALGSYIATMVHRYVTLDGRIGEPIVPVYTDETETAEVEEPEEAVTEVPEVEAQPETPVVEEAEEELPPEAGEPKPTPAAPPAPVAAPVDLSPLEAKLDAILSGQQATSAQMVAAQQAHTDKIVAAIEDSQNKIRAALEGVGQIVQTQNDLLGTISEVLGALDERSESTNNLARGLVTSTEGISGSLEHMNTQTAQPLKAGFNKETQEIVSGLLAYLQQLNAPALVEKLSALEETIVASAVAAGAAATGGGDLTIREIIAMGGTVTLGGQAK